MENLWISLEMNANEVIEGHIKREYKILNNKISGLTLGLLKQTMRTHNFLRMAENPHQRYFRPKKKFHN
jgi:hypothetical protein